MMPSAHPNAKAPAKNGMEWTRRVIRHNGLKHPQQLECLVPYEKGPLWAP
jgi:hypothetical protein